MTSKQMIGNAAFPASGTLINMIKSIILLLICFIVDQNMADILLHPLHVQHSNVTDDEKGQPG